VCIVINNVMHNVTNPNWFNYSRLYGEDYWTDQLVTILLLWFVITFVSYIGNVMCYDSFLDFEPHHCIYCLTDQFW